MKEPLNILFYENGDPVEYRCIERSLRAFPKGYWKVVRNVINATGEGLGQVTFKTNVADLLRSFKMTRAGAFQGLTKNGLSESGDKASAAVDECWNHIKGELLSLKNYVDKNVDTKRSRVLVELSREAEGHVIETTSSIFRKLFEIKVKNPRGRLSQLKGVAASKILFAVLPEIALPVDKAEWKHVFNTNDYSEVLKGMLKEIKMWEKASNKKLDELDKPLTTLPAIYNVLAMGARPQ